MEQPPSRRVGSWLWNTLLPPETIDIASCLHHDARAGCFLSSLPEDPVTQTSGRSEDLVPSRSPVRVMDIPGSSVAVRLRPGFTAREDVSAPISGPNGMQTSVGQEHHGPPWGQKFQGFTSQQTAVRREGGWTKVHW